MTLEHPASPDFGCQSLSNRLCRVVSPSLPNLMTFILSKLLTSGHFRAFHLSNLVTAATSGRIRGADGPEAGDTGGQGKALILPITEEVPALLFPLLHHSSKPATLLLGGKRIKPGDVPKHFMSFQPGLALQCLQSNDKVIIIIAIRFLSN